MKYKDKKVKRLPVVFPIDVKQFAEAAEGEVPKEIHVLPVGKWNHPYYGPIVIEREDIAEFKENFDGGLRKGIPITEGHDNGMSGGELPAIGWFTELIDRGANGLYAAIDWTERGKTLLAEKAFKFFSPEFYAEYEDPETREIFKNVLVGGALTNKPYFKELDAVVLSEAILNNELTFNEDNNMDLQELLAKAVADLSAEEKTFLKENADKLTDEQKETFKDALADEGEGDTETEEEKTAREEKEAGDANEANGLNRDGSAKEEEPAPEGDEPVEASEPVLSADGKKMTMSTLAFKALEAKANAGHKAAMKLEASEVKAEAGKLTFSTSNPKGRFLPAQSAKVLSFMEGLNDKQRKEFSDLVSAIPASKMFKEVGTGAGSEGSAFAEMEAGAKKLMSEDKDLGYADAIKRVCAENPELAERYANQA